MSIEEILTLSDQLAIVEDMAADLLVELVEEQGNSSSLSNELAISEKTTAALRLELGKEKESRKSSMEISILNDDLQSMINQQGTELSILRPMIQEKDLELFISKEQWKAAEVQYSLF